MSTLKTIQTLSKDGYASVGLGIMMIVASIFCRYGAEVKEGKANVDSRLKRLCVDEKATYV